MLGLSTGIDYGLFILSSDYEVFTVSRIKAALIMFTIFCAFTTLKTSAVKPIAISFAVGVAVERHLADQRLPASAPGVS